jgi:hypothetical protein
MMRSVEILLVIIILTGAFIVASSFAVLPEPRQASPVNLRRVALTTLQMLDSNHELSEIAFSAVDDPVWNELQVALSASLPPDMVYNLTVYEVDSSGSGAALYTHVKHISNAESLGVSSDASSYFVASSNVTFAFTPEKISGTLYILNCSDANGWWITGYTAQSLAQDLYNLLNRYFKVTVIVNSTDQLRQLVDGQKLSTDLNERGNETVQNAVIINTFGEAVPMPAEYYQGNSRSSEGYDASAPSGYGYVKYCHTLGKKTLEHNWTWASIVGYPFYYVSNTAVFANEQNNWGIYGMRMTSQGGVRAFLQGLDNQQYNYTDSSVISSVSVVTLNKTVTNYCNYYGIYPSSYQTSTRALNLTKLVLNNYNLTVGLYVFNQVGDSLPGAIYNHVFRGSTNISGSLLALGVTRTPDIRLTAISLLSYYRPTLYPSEYTAYGTSRLVVLQLGLVGGG